MVYQPKRFGYSSTPYYLVDMIIFKKKSCFHLATTCLYSVNNIEFYFPFQIVKSAT